jgi:hypothetical protein
MVYVREPPDDLGSVLELDSTTVCSPRERESLRLLAAFIHSFANLQYACHELLICQIRETIQACSMDILMKAGMTKQV